MVLVKLFDKIYPST
uniref:Uncharacterized protein n=1 Tax=Rhizophora mucronata TaxID=61149 RepID=A0A2P2NWZ5_RHIMU